MSRVFTFTNVPIPPSSNHSYSSFMRNGRIVMVKNKDLVAYKLQMKSYFLLNASGLKFARELLEGFPICFDVRFGFERSRVFTKKGAFKALDTSNRIKAIADCFAEHLLIDDRAFVEIKAVKYSVPTKEREGAEVILSACEFLELE